MVQNGPKGPIQCRWSKWSKRSKTVQKGPKRSKTVQKGPKRSQMVQNSQNGPKWSEMVKNGPFLSKMVWSIKYGPKLFEVTKMNWYGPNFYSYCCHMLAVGVMHTSGKSGCKLVTLFPLASNSWNRSNVCKGMGINWGKNLRKSVFCLQWTLSKIWVSSDHRLIFTVFGIMLWRLTLRAVTVFHYCDKTNQKISPD